MSRLLLVKIEKYADVSDQKHTDNHLFWSSIMIGRYRLFLDYSASACACFSCRDDINKFPLPHTD